MKQLSKIETKASPHRAPIGHNRLYCHNMVSIYKITKKNYYNPLKMDYNPNILHVNIILYNRL